MTAKKAKTVYPVSYFRGKWTNRMEQGISEALVRSTLCQNHSIYLTGVSLYICGVHSMLCVHV